MATERTFTAGLSSRRAWRAALCLAGSACAWTAGIANGAVVASEGFEAYSLDSTNAPTGDNTLHQNSTGGTGWGAAWSASGAQTTLLVVSPTTPLSYNVTNANSQVVGSIAGGSRALQFNSNTNTGGAMTAGRTFASAVNANEAWARILFRYDAGVVENADFLTVYFGNDLARPNFHMFGGSTPTSDFGIRNGTTGIANGGPDIGTGDVGATTYLMVARLSKTTPGTGANYDRLEMWVNPTLDASNNLPVAPLSAGFTGSFSSFASVGIRATNLEPSPDADVLLLDELQFGTAVGDVVPGAVGVVPEPGTLALLSAATAGLLVRRRRRP